MVDMKRRLFFRGRSPEPEAGGIASVSDACITQRDVECRICGEACDAGAIRFPPRLGGISRPLIDAERCTGCRDCVAPCPVQAISMARGG
jgi:ferredoxin-type protein NapF